MGRKQGQAQRTKGNAQVISNTIFYNVLFLNLNNYFSQVVAPKQLNY
jgi:hypothetical protein